MQSTAKGIMDDLELLRIIPIAAVEDHKRPRDEIHNTTT